MAAQLCRTTLLPLAGGDWSVPAGYLEWSARETLEHVARTQLFYDDIARGFGVTFAPTESLCRCMVNRLFPWAPSEVDAWPALLWANGRRSLPGHARVGAPWTWRCAPLVPDHVERS